jgi:hypothetical protein
MSNDIVNFIGTSDGGVDWLLPGRWIARLWIGRQLDTSCSAQYAPTEKQAVQNLKATLRWKWPGIYWYQDLPIVHEDDIR